MILLFYLISTILCIALLENDYRYLLNKADKTTLYNHRLQKEASDNIAPSYIKDLFNIRYTNYQLRGSNILSLPRINTTSYGSKSIRYFGPKIWNFLDDNLRIQPDLQSFKKFVRLLDFENL